MFLVSQNTFASMMNSKVEFVYDDTNVKQRLQC